MGTTSILTARFILGGIFALAGYSKWVSGITMADEIMDYRIVSRRHAELFGPALSERVKKVNYTGNRDEELPKDFCI